LQLIARKADVVSMLYPEYMSLTSLVSELLSKTVHPLPSSSLNQAPSLFCSSNEKPEYV